MLTLPEKADRPTMYFIGVTTGQSSIMKLFPKWADALGLKDACLKGIDIGIHAPAEDYRQAVEFIKGDPLSLGALVTTHKIDLYNAAGDLFDYFDPYAEKLGELSSISKLDGKLCGHAKDPISSGMALQAFIPKGYWREHRDAEVLILGAGGSALAMSMYMARGEFGDDIPKLIRINNRSKPRLDEAAKVLADSRVPMEYELCPTPADNDAFVKKLPDGSLVVNATGLGKDRPGSPITDSALFPRNGIVWELNYRGTLEFMHQAERQEEARNLDINDGWIYFIHGWTQVIAEVFHTDITGERFEICEKIANAMR